MAPSSANPPHNDGDVPVGRALARFRRRARLTGQELGKRAGMSQAKISKIENGVVRPSPDDVERLARELGASGEEIARLVAGAEQLRDQMLDWRAEPKDPSAWQHEIANLEAEAAELRYFHTAMVSGMLQTSEYARAVLSDTQEVWAGDAVRPLGGIADAVAARMGRQKILEAAGKNFHFVVPEGVLRLALGRPEDMAAQLRRLIEVSRQSNVTMSIMTDSAHWPHPPLHGFSLLDDRCVVIDLYNTVVVTKGDADARLYRRVFDAFESNATTDVEPIIEKYRQRYLRLAAG